MTDTPRLKSENTKRSACLQIASSCCQIQGRALNIGNELQCKISLFERRMQETCNLSSQTYFQLHDENSDRYYTRAEITTRFQSSIDPSAMQASHGTISAT